MKSWISALVLAGAVLLPTASHAWWDEAWAYRKEVTVDGRAAGVVEGQKRFPALVRLDSSNFVFEDAKAAGEDLRFVAQDDRTPLNFHVESFDAKTGLATAWIDLPELPAAGQTKLWLYYGNPDAAAAGPAARTYDATYRAVWHFAAEGAPQDATANRVAAGGSVPVVGGSAIGRGARFDGSQALNVPASAATAVDPAQGFTFEAWIRPQSASGAGAIYAGQGLVIGLDAGRPYLEVLRNGAPVRVTAPTGVGANWTHLAATASAQGSTLYLDGRPVATAPGLSAPLSGAAVIGLGYVGDMDEARLSAVARSAAYVAATATSQGRSSRLLTFGGDQEQGGHGFGHFGVIIKNTPLDAWIVIGVLAVMFVVAAWVMWAKAGYVNRAAQANRAFLERFAELRDLTALGASGDRLVQSAPLYALYRTAMAELPTFRHGGRISPEGLEAIRASVDAEQVQQNEKLDASMVLLTIAISGGPFIGLLGTVLGVMITFAAVAAAGDVNVNAIAPGIAAALLATVAGLAVAIPALFGYNYLNSRITALSNQMTVFGDRLITRLAEAQARGALPLAAE